MAEIVWGAPLVEYAQFQVHASTEELGLKDLSDGYTLGYAYALWFKSVSDGFEAGVKAAREAVGKAQNVTGQYQESLEEHVHNFRGPYCECGAVDEEELKAEELIKSKLGATTVEPWTQTPETKPKAWDNFDI